MRSCTLLDPPDDGRQVNRAAERGAPQGVRVVRAQRRSRRIERSLRPELLDGIASSTIELRAMTRQIGGSQRAGIARRAELVVDARRDQHGDRPLHLFPHPVAGGRGVVSLGRRLDVESDEGRQSSLDDSVPARSGVVPLVSSLTGTSQRAQLGAAIGVQVGMSCRLAAGDDHAADCTWRSASSRSSAWARVVVALPGRHAARDSGSTGSAGCSHSTR